MKLTQEQKELLLQIAKNNELLEIGRLKVESALIELRDARISMMRNNGLVIKEKDGTPSVHIRLGPEDCIRIGLMAIAEADSEVSDDKRE